VFSNYLEPGFATQGRRATMETRNTFFFRFHASVGKSESRLLFEGLLDIVPEVFVRFQPHGEAYGPLADACRLEVFDRLSVV
jgi:hypothetical protein